MSDLDHLKPRSGGPASPEAPGDAEAGLPRPGVSERPLGMGVVQAVRWNIHRACRGLLRGPIFTAEARVALCLWGASVGRGLSVLGKLRLRVGNRLQGRGPVPGAPVRTGPRAFVGGHCIILKGVTIGEGAVVGAGRQTGPHATAKADELQRRMRTCILTHAARAFGFVCAKAFRQRGHEVELFSMSNVPSFMPDVAVRYFGRSGLDSDKTGSLLPYLRLILPVRRAPREFKPDIRMTIDMNPAGVIGGLSRDIPWCGGSGSADSESPGWTRSRAALAQSFRAGDHTSWRPARAASTAIEVAE